MKRVLKHSIAWAFAVISVAFMVIPETVFSTVSWSLSDYVSSLIGINASDLNVIFNRIICFLAVWAIMAVFYKLYSMCRCSVTISNADCIIKVEYGNLLKKKNCKKVINFDECYTTAVSDAPADIKPDSLCGQYLLAHPDLDMPKLLKESIVKVESSKSKYQGKNRFKSGTIVPNGNDLLMAFAQLDENGLGMFPSLSEYLDCLSFLWEELDKHYALHDVCIPILGTGLTRIGYGKPYSKQELLDLMIFSYKMSCHKIKKPYKLRIVCKKGNDFSLENIGVR